jgi:hypothetical protein
MFLTETIKEGMDFWFEIVTLYISKLAKILFLSFFWNSALRLFNSGGLLFILLFLQKSA